MIFAYQLYEQKMFYYKMYVSHFLQGTGVGANTAHFVIGIVVFGLIILNVSVVLWSIQ